MKREKIDKRYTVNVNKETAEELERQASQDFTTVAQVIRWAIKHWIKKGV
jgi:predicted DNA-binding protein